MRYFSDFSSLEASEDEPLVIHRHGDTASSALIILLHGLGGSRYGTWTPTSAEPTKTSLPKFLHEDLANLDVGLYAYRTAWRRLRWWKSIALEHEASVLADRIRELVQSGSIATYSTIILAGHSMGGILARAAVSELIYREDRRTLSAIKALLLLATPQAGSLRVPRWLQSMTPDTRALAPHGPLVTKIAQTFTNRVVADPSHAGPTHFVVPLYVVAGAEDNWVDRFSAGISVPDDRKCNVRGSHTSPVKPHTKTDDTYLWVRDRLADLLRGAGHRSNPFEACVFGGKLLIGRVMLRETLRDVANDEGKTRVLAVKGPPRSGKSHSMYFIEHLEPHCNYEMAVIKLENEPATFDPVELVTSILLLINADPTRIPPKSVNLTVSRWVERLAMQVVGFIKARQRKLVLVLDGFGHLSLPVLTRELVRELVKHADREPRLRIVLLGCTDDLLLPQMGGRLVVEPIGGINEEDLRRFFIGFARSLGRPVPTAEVLDEIVQGVLEAAPSGGPADNEKIAIAVERWTERLEAAR